MFKAMDSRGSAFSYSGRIHWQVVESRVKCVLWQEDGRVTLVEKHLKRGSQLTIHEKLQAQHSIEKLCGIHQLL